jgi:hypothetical protein
MSESSDVKKRKTNSTTNESTEPKKTLFVLLFDNYDSPPREKTRYVIFTSGENVEVYDRLCNRLLFDMKDASKGWNDVADAENTWVPWLMFMCYNSTYGDKEKADGYNDAEDYRKKRNQKARQVMQQICMIRSIEDYTNDAVGADFIKEEIGDFNFASERDVMEAGAFTNVMFVPSACNYLCLKYYKKIESLQQETLYSRIEE